MNELKKTIPLSKMQDNPIIKAGTRKCPKNILKNPRISNISNIGIMLHMLDTIEAAGEIEVNQLIQRLADTEAAMERIVVQMGNLSRTLVHDPQCTDTQVLKDSFRSTICFFKFFFLLHLNRNYETIFMT